MQTLLSDIAGVLLGIVALVFLLGVVPLLIIGLVTGSRWRGARLVLSVAQFVSVLACIGSIVAPIIHFVLVRQSGGHTSERSVVASEWYWLAADIGGGFLGFCLFASLFIVFGRAKESE